MKKLTIILLLFASIQSMAQKVVKVTGGDSAIWATKYTLDTTRDNLYDAIGSGGGGSVTNVATGYGLSGGPITTTGTIAADTTVTAKLRDAAINAKLPSSDTANYVHKNYNITETVTGSKTFNNVTTNFLGRTPKTKSNYFPTETAVTTINNSKYNFTGLMDYFSDGTIVNIVREGRLHVADTGVLKMYTSIDQGQSWSTPTTIYSETGVDARGQAGGITPSGRLVVFFARYAPLTSTFLNQGYIYSDDKGLTWSSYATIGVGGSNTIFLPYAGMIHVAGDTLVQGFHGNDGVNYGVYIVKSGDNGATWSSPITVLTSAVSQYAELAVVYLSGSTIIGLVRNSNGTAYRQVKSTDNGTTWTDVGNTTFETFTSGNCRQGWLCKYLTPTGKQAVVYYYVNNPGGKLRSTTGFATDIITGVSGWGTSVDLATLNVSLFALGYPSFIHPFGQSLGYGTFCDQSSTSNATIRFISAPANLPTLTASAITALTTVTAGTAMLSGTTITSGTALIATTSLTTGTTASINGGTILGSDGLAVGVGARILRAGPAFFNFERTGANSAANQLGVIGAVALNSASTRTVFSAINFYSPTITNGAEVGEIRFNNLVAGASTDVVKIIGASMGIGMGATALTEKLEISGNISLATAGNKIKIATGTNASVGVSAAMTAGSITISTTATTASSKIFLTPIGAGAGQISLGTVTAGTSFVINSSDGADTRTVQWFIIN